MKTFLGKIVHGCEDVSMLIVRSSDEVLSLPEKALVQSHLLFCKCCKNFIKESAAIDKSLAAYFQNMQTLPQHKLSDEKKREMEAQLK
jgi:predicted anti-sigma-YlaC factor YlaD